MRSDCSNLLADNDGERLTREIGRLRRGEGLRLYQLQRSHGLLWALKTDSAVEARDRLEVAISTLRSGSRRRALQVALGLDPDIEGHMVAERRKAFAELVGCSLSTVQRYEIEAIRELVLELLV